MENACLFNNRMNVYCSSILALFLLGHVEGFVHSTNITRHKRDTCNDLQFQCASTKKCIDADSRCDAIVDCPDRSDETSDCKKIVSCPGFLYTCQYGACIEQKKRCDGNKDCWDNSDELNCILSSRDKSEGNCSSNQFECSSGQCIDLDNKCNGKRDCTDGSDETREACLNIYCPGFTFKCKYGACIDRFRKCDGVEDCVDGSDEENCGGTRPKPTPRPTPTPPTGTPSSSAVECRVPPNPENGKWTSAKPGAIVPDKTLLFYACDSGYRARLPSDYPYIACLNGKWNPKVVCEKTCPAQYSKTTLTFRCYEDQESLKEIKCTEAIHNSLAKIECARYYEFPHRPAVRQPITRFCFNGQWNAEFPQCVPVCGEKKVLQTLIVKGDSVEIGNYPWVTAIFQNIDPDGLINVCGGSMLTQNLILTAAHCVTNDDGSVLDSSNVKIAVGKYYNKFQDSRDIQSAQYSDVKKIIKPDKYNGIDNFFQSDIAILVTKEKLNFSKFVQPVCFENVNQLHLKLGMEGVVTGWGYTKAGSDPSDELKEIRVPYKDDATCKAELDPSFFRFSTLDKFCAGHYNRSIAVCKGDSGGGLVFQGSNSRFYVVGLVSVANIENSKCNVQASAFYTNVGQHYDWLEENVSKYNLNTIQEPR